MAKLRRFSGTPVSEGVRIEVGKYTVFAVRNAKKDISVRMRREPRNTLRTLMRIPFLRGATRFLRNIFRLLDGLGESAELKPNRPLRGTKFERGLARFFRVHPQSIVSLVSAILIPLILFAGIYAAPEGAEYFLRSFFSLTRAQMNGIVCAVRIVGMLAAVGTIARLRVLNRLGMYQGAINKVINCYECRDEISMANAADYPIHTRRSEPVFTICVMVLSMIVFSWIRVDSIFLGMIARIVVVLLVAAVFNEPYIALEAAELTLPVRIVRAPLDLVQHITALEPQPQMLEVAVCAFKAALDEYGPESEVNKN